MKLLLSSSAVHFFILPLGGTTVGYFRIIHSDFNAVFPLNINSDTWTFHIGQFLVPILYQCVKRKHIYIYSHYYLTAVLVTLYGCNMIAIIFYGLTQVKSLGQKKQTFFYYLVKLSWNHLQHDTTTQEQQKISFSFIRSETKECLHFASWPQLSFKSCHFLKSGPSD